jgi:hypothetical protein
LEKKRVKIASATTKKKTKKGNKSSSNTVNMENGESISNNTILGIILGFIFEEKTSNGKFSQVVSPFL